MLSIDYFFVNFVASFFILLYYFPIGLEGLLYLNVVLNLGSLLLILY